MTACSSGTALYCLFHNHGRYQTEQGESISHIYSGVVTKGDKGLNVEVFDYDGNARSIDTDSSGKQFDLAAIIPVSIEEVERARDFVQKLNILDSLKKWPFYFSMDMSVWNEREAKGRLAICPEGKVSPAQQVQNTAHYHSNIDHIMVRINCVRMSLLTAKIAGIDLGSIGIHSKMVFGEDVRDSLKEAFSRTIVI